jgi:hypothetical protein
LSFYPRVGSKQNLPKICCPSLRFLKPSVASPGGYRVCVAERPLQLVALMQFRELRRVLQTIVLAGLPACDLGVPDSGGDECYRSVVKEFVLETPADPPLQLRIESCRVDADACAELCTMVMQRAGLGTPYSCAVTFQGSEARVTTSYQEVDNPNLCGTEGRRPAGLVEPRRIDARDAVGRWLAHAAWLEAASIPAFIYLARELDQHGAPRMLSRLALAAARDEVRHARIMRAVAARYGATPPAVDVALPQPRSLEEMAIENAIEGCVRETWGAVVALWQAHRAEDAELRAIYRGIAEDEARHAALGWMIDAWVRTRIDEAAQARMDAARDAAVRELFAGSGGEALAVLGLPHGDKARELIARTAETVWMRRAG